MLALLTVLVFCILHLNVAKRSNVVVTLHHKDVHSLFTVGEIWGIQSHNKTADIVEAEVVIDERKLMKINELKLNKDTIMAIDVIWPDADEAVRKERERIDNATKWTADISPDIFFQEYRNWPEYEAFIAAFLLRFPEIASVEVMDTQTVQGRNILVVKLSTGGSGKPGFYIQGCIHAREWLACAAVTKILNDLAEGYDPDDDDNEITAILQQMDVFIVPVLNVDGYIFSWEVNRNWRKNRRDFGLTFGVDLNRNYDGPANTWCSAGASTNPSSDSYCGPSAMSEPETVAGINFIRKPENNIQAVFDLHTSGQYIMYPQAWTVAPLPSPYNEEYATLAQQMSDAVYAVNNYRYNAIQCAPTFLAAGSSIDFGWSQGGDLPVNDTSPLAFGFEGRGPGFNPDPSNIIPGGREQLRAVIVVAKQILGMPN